jgi:tRNA (adenine37-N6)-methyltransferase
MKYCNVLLIGMGLMLTGCSESTRMNQLENSSEQFILYPIGKVVRENDRTQIVIDQKYQSGLLGLDKYSHITVVYWFDKNDNPVKRSILQVHPRGDQANPLTGVFGTHSPVRPNLIAISRCKIISLTDNVIEVEDIDAFHNSPVIDLKGDFFFYHKR